MEVLQFMSLNILFSPYELRKLKESINKQKKNCVYNNQKGKIETLNRVYNTLSNIEYHNKRS